MGVGREGWRAGDQRSASARPRLRARRRTVRHRLRRTNGGVIMHRRDFLGLEGRLACTAACGDRRDTLPQAMDFGAFRGRAAMPKALSARAQARRNQRCPRMRFADLSGRAPTPDETAIRHFRGNFPGRRPTLNCARRAFHRWWIRSRTRPNPLAAPRARRASGDRDSARYSTASTRKGRAKGQNRSLDAEDPQGSHASP
jgi:hypothetical protein